jgi:hypothetical protein
MLEAQVRLPLHYLMIKMFATRLVFVIKSTSYVRIYDQVMFHFNNSYLDKGLKQVSNYFT